MKRLVAVLLVMAMIMTVSPAVFAATESGNWMIAAGATQEWTAPASGKVALSSESGNSIAAIDAEGNYLAMGANPSFEAVEGDVYTIQHFGEGFDIIYWELTAGGSEGGDVGGETVTSGSVEVEAYGTADWTAPQDGSVKFTINIAGATLAIVNGFSPIAEGADSVTAKVTAGTTYLIAPGFNVTENSVVTWEYVEDAGDEGEEGGEAGEVIPNGGALSMGDNNVTLNYATMPMMAANWTYTATESGNLTVTVISINGETNLGMAFGRGMYTLLVGESDGQYTNTVTTAVTVGETVQIAVLDTMDMDPVPAVINVAFEAGEPVVEKNPADYFKTNDMDQFILNSLVDGVEIFSGNGDVYFAYTAEADGAVHLTPTVEGMAATNCAVSVNNEAFIWGAEAYAVNVSAGDSVLINVWGGFEGVALMGEAVEEGGDDTGDEGGDALNPDDYFEKDENGNYIISSLTFGNVGIFVGDDDITYVYTAEADGVVTVTATVEDAMVATYCWTQVNDGGFDTTAAPMTVSVGDKVYINIWSNYTGVVSLTTNGTSGGDDGEKNPADYFEKDDNGYYVIPSLEENVEIFVGNDDINYIYTAECDDTLYVTATVDGYTATNCWIKVNDGEFVTYTEPVAVTAGDVVIINIWSGYEGIVSLGEAAEVPGGDDVGGGETGNAIPNGGALALGDNNVTLTYATMPMMAANWTYTATESGYLTVTVSSVNGNTMLDRPFGMNMYMLLVGETDGMGTNTATVFVNAGQTVQIAVLDSADFDDVPAVINVAFEAGEGGNTEVKEPADYFETNDMDQFILNSLVDGVEIFSGNGDVYFAYTAEADGAVHLTPSVEGNAATNCAVSVNGGEFKWGTSAYAVNVSAGDSVLINVWGGFEGVAVLGEAVEDGGEGGETPDEPDDSSYIIESLENPVTISVGDADITYTYVAEAAGTLSVTLTADTTDNPYLATQCWIFVNGVCTYASDPVTVVAGDVVGINIWQGYEGVVSLETAPQTSVVINAQPVDFDFIVGQDATFTVDASNVAKYVWYWRKSADAEFEIANAFATYKSATLIVNVKGEYYNGYEFKCRLDDADGNQTWTDVVKLYPKVANVTIGSYGKNDPVVEGVIATYTLYNVQGAVRYQWMQSADGGNTWTVMTPSETNGADTARFNIKVWPNRVGYLYRCKIWDADGAYIYSENFVMKMKENPLVGEDLEEITWAIKNKNINLTFNVSGAEIAKYQWFTSRDGVNWGKSTLPGYNTATFTMAAYQSRDNMYLRCMATAVDGNKIYSNVTQLKIEPAPFDILLQPTSVTCTSKDKAVFTVEVGNYDGDINDLTFQWQYLSTKEGAKWSSTGAEGNKTNTLTVPASGKNGYQYRCQISDPAGHVLYTNFVVLRIK